MARGLLVIGESGSGKTTSLRTLNNKETYIINVFGKDLPWRGWKKKYQTRKGGNLQNNLTNFDKVIKLIEVIAEKREDIKNIIIDDMQYIMLDDYMNKLDKNGFNTYKDLAQNMWKLTTVVKNIDKDLNIIFLAHSDTDSDGKVMMKTVGKMFREKCTPEGMFTVVLQTYKKKGSNGKMEYGFITNGDETNLAKSPLGMFPSETIPNDMDYVIKCMNAFYNDEDIPQLENNNN